MHNMKILPDSHIPENPPVPRRHRPLCSTLVSYLVCDNDSFERVINRWMSRITADSLEICVSVPSHLSQNSFTIRRNGNFKLSVVEHTVRVATKDDTLGVYIIL